MVETEIDLNPIVTGIYLQRGIRKEDSSREEPLPIKEDSSREEPLPIKVRYSCSSQKCSWGGTKTKPFL